MLVALVVGAELVLADVAEDEDDDEDDDDDLKFCKVSFIFK